MATKPVSPCTFPGCGRPAAMRGRCVRHKRGTTAQRGYGSAHKHSRATYEHAVLQGRVRCWRCELPIRPDEAWDLGHDDHDRTLYRGPEHQHCNRSAAAKRQMSE